MTALVVGAAGLAYAVLAAVYAARSRARMRAMGRHPSTWAGRAVINARRGFVAAAELGQAFTCPFCGDPVDVAGDPAGWHVDHGTPRAYGGGHDPANLRPAHALCNMRAGQRLSTRKALRPW